VLSEAQAAQFLGIGVELRGVVSAIEVGGDGKAGFGACRSDVVEHFLIAGQGFSGPVLGDLGEQAVFDGVPLGGPGGIVRHGDAKGEGIA